MSESEVIVRVLRSEDWEQWCNLWKKYLLFYKTELSLDIYTTTFNRIKKAHIIRKQL